MRLGLHIRTTCRAEVTQFWGWTRQTRAGSVPAILRKVEMFLSREQQEELDSRVMAYQDLREVAVAIGHEVGFSPTSEAYKLAQRKQREAGMFVVETLESVGFGYDA